MLLKYCCYATWLLLAVESSCNSATERTHATVIAAGKIRNPAEEYTTKKGVWYFPAKTFVEYRDSTKADSMTLNWYSGALRILKEPILYTEASRSEAFRFTCLRSFDAPFAIRVEKSAAGPAKLVLKIADGTHGDEPRKLVVNTTKELSSAQWEQLDRAAKASEFWQMPTRITDFGCDGSEWIMEGKSQGNYHVVNRWSPKTDSNYRALCLKLVELSGVKFKNVN